tara:strand:- start:3197 stop:3829 length:633 start_codon:yes stop_codon:yes gene_type:complete
MVQTRVSIKATFFDSAKVIASVNRAKIKVLSRAGSFVRRTAKQSIRKPPKREQAATTRQVQQRRKKSAESGDGITRLQYGYAKHSLGINVSRGMKRADAGLLIRDREQALGIRLFKAPKVTGRRGQAPRSLSRILPRSVFFGYDAAADGVFVGPVAQRPNTVAALEHGGTVTLTSGPNKGERVRVHNPFMKPAMEKESPKFAGLFRGSVK